MMKLRRPGASVYVPDGEPLPEALSRTTHLGVGAHPDDLEFMALHGVLAAWRKPARWFGGVTCTNGGGSVRAGAFASLTDEQLIAVRREEQNAAARIGGYSFMAHLDYASAAVKDPANTALKEDLVEVLALAQPEVVYTHNPADKHDTHVSVVVALLRAARELPEALRPRRVLGCELWRGLDWMNDAEKMVLDVSGQDDLAAALNAAFASQITGGKRYDLAVPGRSRANATFLESHAADALERAWFAMDLTPLVEDPQQDIVEYVGGFIQRFAADVRKKLNARLGR